MRDYKQYTILFVDDEAHALKYFIKAFSVNFKVLTAGNAADGFKIIEEKLDEIAILMTDQRMPGETGVQLLEKVRQKYPQIIRILVTAYADLDSAISAVNTGAIYKYVSKPWDINELQITLMRAMDYFMVQKERDQLLKEKMLVVQQIVVGSQEKNLAVLGLGLSPFLPNSMQGVSRFIELTPYELAKLNPSDNYWKDVEARTNLEIDNLSYIASTLKKVFDSEDCEFEEPQDISSILGKVEPELENHLILNIKEDLAKIRVNSKQILKLVALLCNNLQSVSGGKGKITLNVNNCSGNGEKDMIELLFRESTGEWAENQWCQFFSPLIWDAKNGKKFGFDLLICSMIVAHHNGELEIPGKEEAKVIVRLPCNPITSSPSGKQTTEQLLHRILKNDRSWDYY